MVHGGDAALYEDYILFGSPEIDRGFNPYLSGSHNITGGCEHADEAGSVGR